MKNKFFLFNSMSPILPRQLPKCLFSIFRAEVLGLQAQGSLHEKLKNLFSPTPLGWWAGMAISGLPLIAKVISFRVLFFARLDTKRTAQAPTPHK